MPEISTAFSAVRMRKYHLAISDVFGGNAFLPVLFLLATLISGRPVLAQAEHSDVYLAALGIFVTCPYLFGLIFQSKSRVLRMGFDSLAVLIIYAVGLGGLFLVSMSHD
jgi:cation:H+ antiporter